jgi:hypothetical protein
MPYPPRSLNWKIPFGQYKGSELWLVIETDPHYVEWLITEAEMKIELDNEAYEALQKELR